MVELKQPTSNFLVKEDYMLKACEQVFVRKSSRMGIVFPAKLVSHENLLVPMEEIRTWCFLLEWHLGEQGYEVRLCLESGC